MAENKFPHVAEAAPVLAVPIGIVSFIVLLRSETIHTSVISSVLILLCGAIFVFRKKMAPLPGRLTKKQIELLRSAARGDSEAEQLVECEKDGLFTEDQFCDLFTRVDAIKAFAARAKDGH